MPHHLLLVTGIKKKTRNGTRSEKSFGIESDIEFQWVVQ